MLILYNPISSSREKAPLPLSLMALGAVLEGHHDYEIVDGNLLDDPAAQLIDILRRKKAIALGMTVMPGPQLNQAVPLTRKVKAALPDVAIIWGGYFPTQHWETVIQADEIDYVVIGQGEVTLLELLNTLKQGGDLSAIKGLIYKKNGSIQRNDPRPLTPITHFPTYPYHRVAMEDYIHPTYLGRRTTAHNSSFGCPFACSFCAITSMTHRNWLPESGERIAQTFKHLQDRHGVTAVQLHDMDFFISEARVVEFAQRIKNYDMSWWALGRIDELSRYQESTWQLMRDSGLKMIFCGAETGSDEMLQRMNKGGQSSTQKTLDLAVKMRQYGIVPEYSFVLGNPPEPERDIEQTFQFIRRLKHLNPETELILYCYTPVPIDAEGNDLYEKAQAAGFQFPKTLDEWTSGIWHDFALRRKNNTPWLNPEIYRRVRNFERVINAYYPTTTDTRLSGTRRTLLKAFGGWRYRLKFYEHPWELRLLQKLFAYQRPETTGF